LTRGGCKRKKKRKRKKEGEPVESVIASGTRSSPLGGRGGMRKKKKKGGPEVLSHLSLKKGERKRREKTKTSTVFPR